MIGALLALVIAGVTPAQGCAFIDEPASWTRGALEAWDRLDAERVRSIRPATPSLVLFNTRCAWTLAPDPGCDFVVGARRYTATSVAHQGQVALPDGGSVSARKVSFAFPTDKGPAFVMALPEVWRADVNEPRDPEHLAMLVFMHGYLKLRRFSSPDEAGPALAAAMQVLGSSDALIIDLRENGGALRAPQPSSRPTFSTTIPDQRAPIEDGAQAGLDAPSCPRQADDHAAHLCPDLQRDLLGCRGVQLRFAGLGAGYYYWGNNARRCQSG